jgi:GT2 family glycosyltransferase
VVVVNYGSHDLLERNLVPLSRELPDLLVVVVDNLSSARDRELAGALALRHDWVFAAAESNLGFGGGMNLGVGVAIDHGAQSVLLLNPDARIDATNFCRLLRRLENRPRALVTPRIVNPDGSVAAAGTDLLLATGNMRGSAKRPAQAAEPYLMWLSGACLLLSRAVWEEVGGFDEDYFLYWEDVDLCVRAAAIGAEMVVEDRATAVHDEGGTQATQGRNSASQAKSSTYYYYNTRNRLLFAARHLAAEDQHRWVCSSVGAAYHILLRGGRRQLVNPSSTLWPAIRGTYDGVRLVRATRRPHRTGLRSRSLPAV